MMKSALAALAFSASVLLTTTAAQAADPYVDPGFDWSGGYIGLNAGYFASDSDANAFVPAASNMNATARGVLAAALNGDIDSSGFTGGLTAGFNHQMNNFVFGFEGDFNYLGLNETRDSGVVAFGGQTGIGRDDLDADFFGTLRLRTGVASGQTLFYLTGGAAFTDAEINRTLDWSFADGCPVVAGRQRCHTGNADFGLGWTVGAGIEHAFNQNFSVKAEYLYADFGNAEFTSTNVGIGASQFVEHDFDLDMHVVRVGLNWHF